MQTNIENTLQTFFNDNLNAFGKIFRSSALVATIDALSPAVLNSNLEVKIQQRLATDSVNPENGLQLNVLRDYSVNFPTRLAAPDDIEFTITSTNFTVGGQLLFVRNLLNSTKLQLISATDGSVVKDNTGSYNTSTGVLTLSGINIASIEGPSIKFSALPADVNTIKPLRNFILKLDPVASKASGTIDFQNTAVTIS